MKKHTPLKKPRGYGTTGPNKDRAVLIWHHRVCRVRWHLRQTLPWLCICWKRAFTHRNTWLWKDNRVDLSYSDQTWSAETEWSSIQESWLQVLSGQEPGQPGKQRLHGRGNQLCRTGVITTNENSTFFNFPSCFRNCREMTTKTKLCLESFVTWPALFYLRFSTNHLLVFRYPNLVFLSLGFAVFMRKS